MKDVIDPMADDQEPQPANPPVPPAEDLGRSYGALLEQQAWQVDVGEPPVLGADAPGSAGASPSPAAGASHLTNKSPVSTAAAVPAPSSPPPLLRIVEALLFVGGPPLTAARAAEAVRGLTPAQFLEAIHTLNQDYRRQGRPYAVQPQDQGYVLALRPRFWPVLERLYGSTREARLSLAAIDVLALVAYRQPVTKQEVDSLRGAESGALLRQLVRRGLIAVVHRGEANQREVSYGTTRRFLELFGLRSLDDLPQTQDLQQL